MKTSFLKVISIMLLGVLFSLTSCQENKPKKDQQDSEQLENIDQRDLDEMEIDRDARDGNTVLSDEEEVRHKKIRESATTEDIEKAQNRVKEANEKLELANRDGDPEVIRIAEEEKRKAEDELERALKKSKDKGEKLKENIPK